MRTLAVAAITGLVALAVAGVASAAPSVSMIWSACAGPGCGAGVGTSSITAAAGDTLTLDMLVITDGDGTTGVALSYDTSVAGVASAYTRPGIDSINTSVVWDFQGSDGNTLAPASATYSGGGLTFLSGVTCPAATGNLAAGFCGDLVVGLLQASQTGTDLGGGIIGSFGTLPGSMSGPHTFTIAQATFEVVPEPATGGLLALGLGALAFIGRRRA